MDIVAVPFTLQTDLISQKQFDEHMTLYKGYVSKVNEITNKKLSRAEYAAANATYSIYRGIKKGESFALDGVILHELYFQNLERDAPVGNAGRSTKAGTGPGRKTRMLMERNWGSIDSWREDFTACAKSARGWCICVYEQRTQTCRNILLDTHDYGLVCGSYPLIVLDMYEHAYFTDYNIDKSTYISRFISQIPWGIIEKRANAVVR